MTAKPRSVVTLAAVTVLAFASVAITASPAVATSATPSSGSDVRSDRLALPRPTGPYAVGRDELHLVDQTRLDPWVPEAGVRELLVSMYYPARRTTGPTAPYLTPTEARLFLEDRGLSGIIAPERLSNTRTHAHTLARPARGRHPLVVLSPGLSVHRHTLTSFAEELASRGYVVAAVDHAYESVGTAFPGGRVLTCAACAIIAGQGFDGSARLSNGRARDVTFLLDQLTGQHPAWRHAGLIDSTRIGMAGHSIGGSAALATMTIDSRVRAGVNMDGTLFSSVPATGLNHRPFLLLGAQSHHSPGSRLDITWDRNWPLLDGWKRWLTVAGTAHVDFSDLATLGEQVGLDDPRSPLPGPRIIHLTRRYVTVFFDRHLRGTTRPLLDGPTPRNPEVLFHHQ